MMWESLLRHLGKINQATAGLVLGVAAAWAILSFREGRVADGLLTLLGAWVAVVVLFGAVGALVQIRDLLAESRG